MKEIFEKCIGCARVGTDGCKVYVVPEAKWRNGNCPMATHLKKEVKAEAFVNPLKASKRKAAGK